MTFILGDLLATVRLFDIVLDVVIFCLRQQVVCRGVTDSVGNDA